MWFDGKSYHYSNHVAVMQSSGSGKSRCAEEMGKMAFTISINIRGEDASAYPPPDRQFASLFKREQGIHTKEDWDNYYNALLLFILRGVGAAFEYQFLQSKEKYKHLQDAVCSEQDRDGQKDPRRGRRKALGKLWHTFLSSKAGNGDERDQRTSLYDAIAYQARISFINTDLELTFAS